jgi:hypothetical protein
MPKWSLKIIMSPGDIIEQCRSHACEVTLVCVTSCIQVQTVAHVRCVMLHTGRKPPRCWFMDLLCCLFKLYVGVNSYLQEKAGGKAVCSTPAEALCNPGLWPLLTESFSLLLDLISCCFVRCDCVCVCVCVVYM